MIVEMNEEKTIFLKPSIIIAGGIVSIVVLKAILDKKTEELIKEKERFLQLEIDAHKDGLTGLYNRRAYEEDIAYYAKKEKLGKDFTFVSVDVNGLKAINDSIGHEAGDELLKGAASCIQRCLGPYGKVYRIGGDEFSAIVSVKSDKLQIIKKNLKDAVMHWKGKQVKSLSISCGYVTAIEFPNKSIEEISKIADKKMYESKAIYYENEGTDRRGHQMAYNVLSQSYSDILKVNLSEDSVHVLKSGKFELEGVEKLSSWLLYWVESGLVHVDDAERYRKYTQLLYLREYFNDNKKIYRIWFRILIEKEYKYVLLEIIASSEYSQTNQMVYLYVKDIEE